MKWNPKKCCVCDHKESAAALIGAHERKEHPDQTLCPHQTVVSTQVKPRRVTEF